MSLDSIGSAGGRDFANLADWFAAIPATLVEDEIGEVYNDSTFTMTAQMNFTGKTPGAFSITLRAATGQGFADSKDNVGFKLQYDASQGAAFTCTTSYIRPLIISNQTKMTIQGIQIQTTSNRSGCIKIATTTSVLRNCILDSNGAGGVGGEQPVSNSTGVVINCLGISRNTEGSGNSRAFAMEYGAIAINCTGIRPSSTSADGIGYTRGGGTTTIALNCVSFGFTTSFQSGGGWGTGTNYNCAGDANAPGANSQQSKTMANQFVSTTDDFRLKAGSDCIDHGNTDATNAPADIVGTTRGATTLGDIGCWEYVAATVSGIATAFYNLFPKRKLRQPITGGRTR